MAVPTPGGLGRVFISYRRDDSAYPAGWLYDRLCAHLGIEHVFKDVDSIDPGDDFVQVLDDAVGSCQVLLALIGDRWLEITDENGHRRLDDADDFVRIEIEAALRRNVRVVPILVGRAPMPKSEQLPESLRPLTRRHAIQLSPNRFEFDLARLLPVIDKTLAAIRDGPTPAPPGEHTGQTSAISLGVEPSTSLDDAVVGADVDSPEKTTQQRLSGSEHSPVDERPARFITDTTDVAQSDRAATAPADTETSNEAVAHHPPKADASSGVSQALTPPAKEVLDRSTTSTAISPDSTSTADAELTPTPSRRGDEHRVEQRGLAPESTAAEEKTIREEAPTANEESREAEAERSPVTEVVSPPGHPDAPKDESLATEDRPAVSVQPSDTTSAAADVPLLRRLNRRTKIVVGLVAAIGLAAVTVAIVVGSITATTDPTSRLMKLVPSGDHCRPSKASYFFLGSIAEVACDPGGPIYGLQYGLYSDQTQLDKRMNLVPDGGFQACPGRGQSPDDWHEVANPQQTGKVECWVAATGGPVLNWSVDSQLLIGQAQANNIDQLYQWWAARYQ